MAQSLKFSCRCCGYCGDLGVGTTRLEYWVTVKWPVLCRGCNSVVVANYRKNPLACLACDSVNVREMDRLEVWLGNGDVVFSETLFYPELHPPVPDRLSRKRWWFSGKKKNGRQHRKMKLTDGSYYCPRCEVFELFFYVDVDDFWIAS